MAYGSWSRSQTALAPVAPHFAAEFAVCSGQCALKCSSKCDWTSFIEFSAFNARFKTGLICRRAGLTGTILAKARSECGSSHHQSLKTYEWSKVSLHLIKVERLSLARAQALLLFRRDFSLGLHFDSQASAFLRRLPPLRSSECQAVHLALHS